MKTEKAEIRYEDNAEQRSVTGWACKQCSRFWGKDEHMARYCCATSLPCKCGARRTKRYSMCKACDQQRQAKEWDEKPSVVWDGEFPIGVWNDDQYFFGEDELIDYVLEFFVDEPSTDQIIETIKALELTKCVANTGREFSMYEFLEDDLHEDSVLDADEIDKTVNDWIEKNAPYSWSMTGKKLCSESVIAKLAYFKNTAD